MTTLPPEPAPHQHRDVAEGFGADAARYDRARPTYPDALIDRILATSPGKSVLDVGCGTGIVARLLKAKGATVLGVEPDPRMAEVARDDAMPGRYSRSGGIDVEVAKIEDWDPAGRVFDAAVAGQAWHWVDPVTGAAAVARALRPGGRLTLFWNSFGIPAEIGDAFHRVFAASQPDLPFNPWSGGLLELYRKGCDKAAEGMAAAGGYGEAERWEFEWSRPYTRDEWLDMVPTLGGMSRLPAEKMSAILDGMGTVIDDAGGAFTVNSTTVAVSAPRS